MAGNKAWVINNPVVQIGEPSTAVQCDLTRAELTNEMDMKDAGTLCGPAQLPGRVTWTLELEGHQSFDTDSLWMFLWDNQRQQVPFTLVPKEGAVSATNPAFTGTITCVPGSVGGTADEIAVYSVSLPLVGDPVKSDTMPAGFMSVEEAHAGDQGAPQPEEQAEPVSA
jgi:hypothetical protein